MQGRIEAVYQMASQSQTGPNGKQAPTTRHQRGTDGEKLVTVEKDLHVPALVATWDYLTAVSRLKAFDSVNFHQFE